MNAHFTFPLKNSKIILAEELTAIKNMLTIYKTTYVHANTPLNTQVLDVTLAVSNLAILELKLKNISTTNDLYFNLILEELNSIISTNNVTSKSIHISMKQIQYLLALVNSIAFM